MASVNPHWPISVVIPCFNGERYVREAIRSALEQTLPPVEILVVDDASTDRSVEVASSVGPPVRVLRQRRNQGAAAARNLGIRAARGSWIAFLDADDRWSKDKLERQCSALEHAGEDVVLAFTDLYYFDDNGPRHVVPCDNPADLDGDYHVHMLTRWVTIPSTTLVRADVAREILFPEGVRNVEDQQFFLLLRRRGRLLHVPGALTGYRRHPGQLTAGPDHVIKAARANTAFVRAHADWYTPAQAEQVRTYYAEWLVQAHSVAFWARNNAVARECRRLYYELHPHPQACPPLFERRLLPSWLARAKDWLEGLWRPRPVAGCDR
jgi:glycosyltransferase involved in cell wall biosynthesis